MSEHKVCNLYRANYTRLLFDQEFDKLIYCSHHLEKSKTKVSSNILDKVYEALAPFVPLLAIPNLPFVFSKYQKHFASSKYKICSNHILLEFINNINVFIAGGFLSYLRGYTNSFNDYDIFILDFNRNYINYIESMKIENQNLWEFVSNYDGRHVYDLNLNLKMVQDLKEQHKHLPQIICLTFAPLGCGYLENIFHCINSFDLDICKIALPLFSSQYEGIMIEFTQTIYTKNNQIEQRYDERQEKYLGRTLIRDFNGNPSLTIKVPTLLDLSHDVLIKSVIRKLQSSELTASHDQFQKPLDRYEFAENLTCLCYKYHLMLLKPDIFV